MIRVPRQDYLKAISTLLDEAATELQDEGKQELAEQIDKISNTVDVVAQEEADDQAARMDYVDVPEDLFHRLPIGPASVQDVAGGAGDLDVEVPVFKGNVSDAVHDPEMKQMAALDEGKLDEEEVELREVEKLSSRPEKITEQKPKDRAARRAALKQRRAELSEGMTTGDMPHNTGQDAAVDDDQTGGELEKHGSPEEEERANAAAEPLVTGNLPQSGDEAAVDDDDAKNNPAPRVVEPKNIMVQQATSGKTATEDVGQNSGLSQGEDDKVEGEFEKLEDTVEVATELPEGFHRPSFIPASMEGLWRQSVAELAKEKGLQTPEGTPNRAAALTHYKNNLQASIAAVEAVGK